LSLRIIFLLLAFVLWPAVILAAIVLAVAFYGASLAEERAGKDA
jgi:hypothetical protein